MSETTNTPRSAEEIVSSRLEIYDGFAFFKPIVEAMKLHTAEHTASLQAELKELKLANKALKGSHESALLLRIKSNRLEAENKRLREESKNILSTLKNQLEQSKKINQGFDEREAQWRDGLEQGLESAIELLEQFTTTNQQESKNK